MDGAEDLKVNDVISCFGVRYGVTRIRKERVLFRLCPATGAVKGART